MKNWKYKARSNRQEIIEKLRSALVPAGGFVFNGNEDSGSFKIRKPVKYPDQILHRNRVVVNGRVLNGETEYEANVEVSFAQDLYMKMTVFSIIAFGCILIALISRSSDGAIMYLLGGIVLAVGFLLWMALNKKLERDTQKYKTLIAEILGS